MKNTQQILNQIRAEFRAIKQEKRGLEGNRAFMDSGWENAEYPPDTHFVPFDANGIHAESVFVGDNPAHGQYIILHCHGGGFSAAIQAAQALPLPWHCRFAIWVCHHLQDCSAFQPGWILPAKAIPSKSINLKIRPAIVAA